MITSGPSIEEQAEASARLLTSPELAALRVVLGAEHSAKDSAMLNLADQPGLLSVLREQGAALHRGDLSHVESMLMNQATALQSLFVRLAERGMAQNEVVPFETNMRIALRAQAQCRAALETLGAIKNPPVVIARQANVTSGPQQINNNLHAHAAKHETAPSKLSEGNDELRANTGTPAIEGAPDLAMASLGAIHGTANAGREGARVAQRVQRRRKADAA